MAQEAVLKYLVDTNRPYSCADVTVNLRGVYSKGVVQKTLDALSESGKIRCKLYGKQKVFVAIQTETVAGDEDVEDFDAQLKTLTQAITDKTIALKTAETTLKTLTSAPTTEAAKSQIEDIKTTISSMESKLESLKNSTEVVNAILEGYPKSKKTLLEELCIETDEMANFKVASAC
ncbi:putative tbp-1 [Operophtera brumata]|uniref:Homologous-pairing protein 2 homolog n=1 Tax=Operophtera brumata TaxID=104452 RepID=A0A0L7L193_OPEBR|nr:putative tbp-1 [Operophtera brumata]